MSFGIPVRNGLGIGLKASTTLSTRGGAGAALPSQQAYTTAGTYSWIAPAGVTSVSVVAVGAGGRGPSGAAQNGGGGGLGWKNNISVTPGNSYTVVVAAGNQAATATVHSYFNSIATVAGYTGNQNNGGIRVGDGGGNGGNSTALGGGGAGGYAGNGGNGGNDLGRNGTAGAGGGGGGGGSSESTGDPNFTAFGGSGGGVGILGQGSNGAAGTFSGTTTATGGGGGSSGANGAQMSAGGAYGGGGCGGGTDYTSQHFNGGVGAVRIIWPGTTRLFPSTNTGNL